MVISLSKCPNLNALFTSHWKIPDITDYSTVQYITESPARSSLIRHSSHSTSQSGALSLVQICPDTGLSLVEIIVVLRQLSYAIKTQLKAPKAPYYRCISCLSLCLYGIRVASMHGKDLLLALASAI